MRILLAILLLISSSALAEPRFTATVNRTNVIAHQPFTLTLTLKEDSAEGNPDTATLEQSFKILGVGRSSQINIINGKSSKSVGWNYNLMPLKEGAITIPAIKIATAGGGLQSQPITINVSEPTPLAQQEIDEHLVVNTIFDKSEVFVNQAFIYTAQIVASPNVANLEMDMSSAPESIIEQIGSPQKYNKVINGVNYTVSDLHYLITPLQAGELTLPVINVKGNLFEDGTQKNHFSNLFVTGLGGNLWGNFEPIYVKSKPNTMQVKAPPIHMNPWLPLHSLEIHDQFSAPKNMVGEPITRQLNMVAKGIAGNQLPSLEAMQQGDGYKVYADQPDTQQQVIRNEKVITGLRTETYTIIPSRPGVIVFPEIKVEWWNVNTQQVDSTTIPSKTLNVLVDFNNPQPPVSEDKEPLLRETLEEKVAQVEQVQFDWQALLGVLVVLGVMTWWWTKPKSAKPAKVPTVKISALRKAKSSAELSQAIQQLAQQKIGLPANSSLAVISRAATQYKSKLSVEEIEAAFTGLEAHMYAGKALDLPECKRKMVTIFKAINRGKVITHHDHENRLNPS